MACWTCGAIGGDPSVGHAEDDGICPACSDQGYEEQCVHGCYTDPQGELHECKRHEGTSAEASYEQHVESFYGSSSTVTTQEQYNAAADRKRHTR